MADVSVDASGRAGIAATDAQRVTIDGVHTNRTGLWLINLEPHGAGRTIRNVTVTDHTTTRGGRHPRWLNAAGPTSTPCRSIAR